MGFVKIIEKSSSKKYLAAHEVSLRLDRGAQDPIPWDRILSHVELHSEGFAVQEINASRNSPVRSRGEKKKVKI